MKFLVDRMLGTAVRYLRVMGYDAVYAGELARSPNEDNTLLEVCSLEERVLLSRDGELISRAEKRGFDALYLHSIHISDQLRMIKERFNIKLAPEMSRCTLCNTTLEEVPDQEMDDLHDVEYVPVWLIDSREAFWKCPNCGQVYWKGSHWTDISKRLFTIENED